MLDSITPEQFEEWLAFGLYLEPFGSDVEWLKTGTNQNVTASQHFRK